MLHTPNLIVFDVAAGGLEIENIKSMLTAAKC